MNQTTPLKVAKVFVPGKLPEFTYNPRDELNLEQSLEDYLEEAGAILTVAGPTKTGKSVLLERRIDNPVWCDGQGVASVDSMWALVSDELGLYTQVEVSSDASVSGGGTVAAKAGFAPLAEASSTVSIEGSEGGGVRHSVSRPLASLAKEALARAGQPLVIDDFHFVERDVQRQVVRALKPIVLAGIPVVFASISHRVRDVVSAEPDMTGRVVPLEIPFWSKADLLYIAREGFKVLNVVDEGEVFAKVLASESYGSPYLMQKFCRELCKVNGVRERPNEPRELRPPSDWASFFSEQVEFASRDWFERLLNGPQERGNKRTQWELRDGTTLDGYGLTLRAIVETGPKLDLTKDEIRRVVDQLVEGTGPALHQTTRYLQRMSLIAAKRKTEPLPTEEELDQPGVDRGAANDVQPVLEYMDDDDPHSRLHIADPYFAFFLRWGSSSFLGNVMPEIAL